MCCQHVAVWWFSSPLSSIQSLWGMEVMGIFRVLVSFGKVMGDWNQLSMHIGRGLGRWDLTLQLPGPICKVVRNRQPGEDSWICREITKRCRGHSQTDFFILLSTVQNPRSSNSKVLVKLMPFLCVGGYYLHWSWVRCSPELSTVKWYIASAAQLSL